jgi:hypothetical protein
LAACAAAWVRSIPEMPGRRSLSRRLETAALETTGTCGGCDNCGSTLPPESTGSELTEVRVPVSTIGKR